jgi:YcxB-like protein
MKSIKLHYSEELVRSAVRAFWFRVTGLRFFIPMTILFAILVYSLRSGDRSWSVGVTGTVFALGVIFAVALYVVHLRTSLRRLCRMRIPEAMFEPSDQRFRVTSDLGATDVAWNAISEVWCFPDFWLLFLSRAQFITLPLADVDSEARELILSCLKSHGSKVR